MKLMITLEFSKTEPNSSMTSPYIGRILSLDKIYYCTTSRLHLFAEKLKTRWSEPFLVQTVFQHGAIEIFDPKNGKYSKSMVID